MLRIALISLLVLNFFLFFILPVKDNDFGWHYRCGAEFLTQGKLCLSNDYAYFLPGYHWAYPSFLYDVSLAGIFNHFGFVGVSVFGAIIFTIIYLIYFFLLKGPTAFRIVLIIGTIALSWSIFSLGYRSQILGLLFFMVELLILERSLWLIPILFFLWANSHASFFLGPLILAVYGIRFLQNRTGLKQYIFIFAISIGATLINPFGWRIYWEIIQHFNSPLNTMIAEWTRPEDWQIIIIVTGIIFSLALSIKNKTFRDYRFLLLVIFGIFAFSARRNLPLYYLVFFYFLSQQIDWKKFELDFVFVSVLLGGVLFFGLNLSEMLSDGAFTKEAYCRNLSLPCEAIQVFTFDSGNIFNTYEWGGYLVWKLPTNKIFVDGRMPAWQDENGESPYAVFLKILQTQPGWNEKLTQLNTKYIFIGRGTFLDLLLQKEKEAYGWKEEYRDNIAVIYKRT